VVPTTSNPSRRSKSRKADITQGSPLKSIRLTLTLDGASPAQLERLSAEKGLSVVARGSRLEVVVNTATAEDALSKMRLISGLLASKA
jgi:hypothetical protein